MTDMIDTTGADSCACTNLRRTDLVVTQFYDGILAPSGLYAVQCAMLGILLGVASTTINHMAEVMDMDRSTLARHVKILVDEDLLRYDESQDGRAERVILTEEGEQALQRAWPLWKEAQTRIVRDFGLERFNRLLGELAAIRKILN